MVSNDKRIRIITGHYGSGKTEFAVNYVTALREQTEGKVAIADLDIVNVYFRSREKKEELEEKGIIGPQDGAKKREVRINKQQWLEMQNQGPAPKMNAETAEQMRFEEAESDEDQTDAE